MSENLDVTQPTPNLTPEAIQNLDPSMAAFTWEDIQNELNGINEVPEELQGFMANVADQVKTTTTTGEGIPEPDGMYYPLITTYSFTRKDAEGKETTEEVPASVAAQLKTFAAEYRKNNPAPEAAARAETPTEPEAPEAPAAPVTLDKKETEPKQDDLILGHTLEQLMKMSVTELSELSGIPQRDIHKNGKIEVVHQVQAREAAAAKAEAAQRERDDAIMNVPLQKLMSMSVTDLAELSGMSYSEIMKKGKIEVFNQAKTRTETRQAAEEAARPVAEPGDGVAPDTLPVPEDADDTEADGADIPEDAEVDSDNADEEFVYMDAEGNKLTTRQQLVKELNRKVKEGDDPSILELYFAMRDAFLNRYKMDNPKRPTNRQMSEEEAVERFNAYFARRMVDLEESQAGHTAVDPPERVVKRGAIRRAYTAIMAKAGLKVSGTENSVEEGAEKGNGRRYAIGAITGAVAVGAAVLLFQKYGGHAPMTKVGVSPDSLPKGNGAAHLVNEAANSAAAAAEAATPKAPAATFTVMENWHAGAPTAWSWAQGLGIPNNRIPSFLNETMDSNWAEAARGMRIGESVSATAEQIAQYTTIG
jgi:hypothetical protein